MPKADPFDEKEKVDRSDPFAKRSGGVKKVSTGYEQLVVDENLGKAMLVWPIQFTEKVITKFTKPGEEGTDAVTVNAVVLDAEDGPKEYKGTMVFAKFVVGQLKGEVGTDEPLLAVLTKAPSQKGHDAWKLDSEAVTEEQGKLSDAYMDELEAKRKASRTKTAS